MSKGTIGATEVIFMIGNEVNRLKARVEELEKDKSRLDWMESEFNGAIDGTFRIWWKDTGLRAAIDAAMETKDALL